MTEYTPLGSEFLVNTSTLNNQAYPTITGLKGGGFVVSWWDMSLTGGDSSDIAVKAQIFAADGSPLGGEFLVNTTTFNQQFDCTITGLASGGFVISWTDQSGVGGDANPYAIKAQIFAANGSRVGGEFLVNATTTGHQYEATIAALANGGFVVSWQDESRTGGDTSGLAVKAQIFAADGSPLGGEFLVNTTTLNHQYRPSITGLANGGFVVSWEDNSATGGDTSGLAVKAQIFAADGSRVGSEFLVNTTTTGQQNGPTIAALVNGGFVVSWGDQSGTGGDTSGAAVKAQIYTADGNRVGGEFLVNTTTSNNQYFPSITGLADGGFVVSWEDYSATGGDSSGFAIRAQIFAADGSRVGSEVLVNTTTSNDQDRPTITGLADGGFVVSWNDRSLLGGDADGFAVKAQIFAPQNSPPVARNDAFITSELSIVSGNLFADNGLGADSDPDGPTLAISAVNGNFTSVGTQITLPSGALLMVNADGTFSYDPNGAFEFAPTAGSGASNTPSSDSFTYTLAGGDTATVILAITGVDNNDFVLGTGGNDVLDAGDGDDYLDGGDGDDILTGGAGNDANYGGSGDDLIRGRSGDDLIDGGDGFDRAGYYHIDELAGGVTVDLNVVGPQDTGSQGTDILTGIEYVSGTPFADTLTGDANDNILWGSAATIDSATNWVSTTNNDTLDGGGGNDLLYVGIGNHSLTGGSGTDTVGFTENFGDDPAINISLALQGVAQDTGQGLWTLTGIENLSGGDDNDQLTGDNNANILAGSFGDDMLSGGGGNDLLYGDGAIDSGAPSSGPSTLFPDVGANGNDLLEGGLGDDQLWGGGGIDTASYANATGAVQVGLFNNATGNGSASGADGNDILRAIENITGSAFNDSLTGNILANVLIGGDGNDGLRGRGGNDTLLGGNGADTLTGGFGDDVIDGGAGFDRSTYFQSDPAVGGVTVSLLLQNSWQNVGSQGLDYLVGIENLSGTPFADSLTGDSGNNWLWGSVATIEVGNVSTTNNDLLDGGDGNDILWVGIGNHTIIGGSGIDTLRFTENGQVALEPGLTVSLALQGVVQTTGNGDWTLSGIENLSGGNGNDTLTGDGNANQLAGSLGADILAGGGGDDLLLGDGSLDFDASNVIVPVFDIGVPGNDLLEGGLGNDTIVGGGGIDTASYANASGGVTAFLYQSGNGNGEASGADGNDTLSGIENITGSAFDDSLGGNNLDNVIDGGDGHDGLRGNGGNDVLRGGNGDEFINGGLGDDTIDGGAGFDRAAFYTDATAGVTVDLNLQGVAQNTGQGMDTLIGIENVSGSFYGDTLTGDGGDNWLWGSASTFSDGTVATTNNDTLTGGGGNDLLTVGIGNHILDGGTGTDTLSFSENGAVETGITVSLAQQGIAQSTGNGSWTLTGIENLSGGTGNDVLAGDGNANVLAGSFGNDVLGGGAGNDILYGDGQIATDNHGLGTSGPITTYADASVTFGGIAGNDILEGGLGDDLLDGGGGIDTASYANASGGVTFNLRLGFSSGADGNDTLVNIENGIGSQFNDNITGTPGENMLDGLGGNDTISGGVGNDTIFGGDGNDFLQGDFGENNILFTGDDLLIGGNGNDSLRGGLGNDTLIGGANNDNLRGNGGVDTFDGGSDDGEGFNGIGDRVSFFEQRATQGVVADLRTGIISNDGFGNVETMVGIESLGGNTAFADTFYGNDERNFLAGDRGDQVYGFGGDDIFQLTSAAAVIDGGAGTDRLNLFSTGGWLMPDSNGDGLAEFAPAATAGWTVNLTAGTTADGHGNSGTVSGIEDINGSHLGDTLTGDANANVLNGFDGDDTLEGRAGNDTLDGGNGIDTASYANAAGSVSVDLSAGTSSGADGNDTLANIENITGSAFNDFLYGNALANVIAGGDGRDDVRGFGGNDTLLAGNGNDFLVGGLGDDTIDGGAGFDRVSFYSDATTGVTVDLNLQGAAQNTGQGMDTLIGIENVSGTKFADTLTGDSGDNWLWGSGASLNGSIVSTTNDDTIDGGGGNDLLTVGIGNHTLIGGTGIDTVRFTENQQSVETGVTISLASQIAQSTGNGTWTLTGIENLSGGTANDTLTGDIGANVLAGDLGNDVLIGGEGNDTLYGDGQIGIDFQGGGGSGPITTYADATGLYVGGVSGNDSLEGGLGDDTLNGGGGIDTASYANAAGGVSVNLFAGTASGADGNDTLLNIENITGSGFTDTLTGNGFANVLIGGDGHDLLRGHDGNDTLLGGTGDDFLSGGMGDDLLDGGTGFDRVSYLAGATAAVTIDLNIQGIAQDTIGAGMDTLIGIEHASGTIYNDTLTGNAGDNWLWGGSDGSGVTGNDLINAGAGNDLVTVGTGNHTLNGDAGVDTLSLLGNTTDITAAGITFSLALQGAAQDTEQGMMNASGFENVSGSIHDDAVTGDGADNMLAGDTGNDSLVGGAGNDTLYGDGRVVIDSHGGGGSGPITTFVDTVASFGGVSGNDLLEGGLGNDTLDGGGGIDTASYANASGGVNVNLGTGTSSGADGNDTLVSIENVTGSAFNDNITGSVGGNVLDGLGGNDTLSGGAGDDTLNGGDGNDFLQGDFAENDISVSGNDVLDGGNGNDSLRGGLGNDTLIGGANNDLLRGNGGVDTFDGGADDGQGFNGIGDRVSFFEQRATQGVVADLRTGIISNDGFGNVETMVGIESLGGDTAFVDTFYGNDNRNFLAGGLGDNLHGFGGDDLFQMSAAVAVVDGGLGTDLLALSSSGAWLIPDTNADGLAEFAAAATAGWTVSLAAGTIVDGYGNSGSVSGIENVSGGHLGDHITGDSNANVLSGVDGNDTLDGGAGNDTLDGGVGIDTASYANASGAVTVNLFAGTASGADGNDTLAGIENITGSAFNDLVVGNNAANFVIGGGGADIVVAFAGDDVIEGGAGGDTLYGMQGNDQIFGGDDGDLMWGGTGNDLIDGGAGFNFVGFAQIQNDTITTGVTVDLNIQGSAQDTGQGIDTLINIQGVAGTRFVDTLIGNDATNLLIASGTGIGAPGGDDLVYGRGGDDLLVVGSGNVLLDGGSGSDTISFNAFNEPLLNGVTVSLALQGSAQNTGSGNMTLVDIENLTGTGLSDTLTGDGNANTLSGAGGNDILVGGAGDDSLLGDAIFTAVTAASTLQSPVLVLDSSVYAGQVAGNDLLEGGLGNDLINGGDGIDTASYANASGGVTVTLTATGGSSTGADGTDTLISIENSTGGAFNDVLTGNGSANVLVGGAGHDSLNGAAGNDTLQGGTGNDSLTGGAGDDVIDGGAGFDRANYNMGATAGVTVDLSLTGAQNTGQGNDTLTGIENVVGTTFNDMITGDGGDNWLWGGSLGTGVTGNDTISGGNGNDLIEVGTGNHTLSGGGGTSDTLSFWAGGTDVTSTGVAFSLASATAQNSRQGTMTATGFENLSGSRYNDVLTGDTQNNILAGGTGNDTLTGGLGSDSLFGDGQYTTFTQGGLATGPIRLVNDITTEFGGVAGNDSLNGGDGDDFLYGGGGNDMLKGDRDNDTLYGGTGNDTLVGGNGNDRYVIEANSGADTISGFAHVDNIFFDASSGVTSFSQLTLTKFGAFGTMVTWGNGNSILIDSLRPNEIIAADFSFAAAALKSDAQVMRVYPTETGVTSSQDSSTSWSAPSHDYLLI